EVETAIYRDIPTYTAYGIANVEVGVPFTLQLFERRTFTAEPLTWPAWLHLSRIESYSRSFWRVSQEYPLALKDANSVHVEIAIPDPELRVPEPKGKIKRDFGLVTRRPGGLAARAPTTDAFGSFERASERLIHLY